MATSPPPSVLRKGGGAGLGDATGDFLLAKEEGKTKF